MTDCKIDSTKKNWKNTTSKWWLQIV